jgi:hypothetical protein
MQKMDEHHTAVVCNPTESGLTSGLDKPGVEEAVEEAEEDRTEDNGGMFDAAWAISFVL